MYRFFFFLSTSQVQICIKFDDVLKSSALELRKNDANTGILKENKDQDQIRSNSDNFLESDAS